MVLELETLLAKFALEEQAFEPLLAMWLALDLRIELVAVQSKALQSDRPINSGNFFEPLLHQNLDFLKFLQETRWLVALVA